LGKAEGFLVVDLDSKEFEELEGELIVLKTFNVVVVLFTSSFE
jgi:hypothetical protein